MHTKPETGRKPDMSEWLLLNANSAIFQLYHGENKLIFNEMDFLSASSLKQQSVGKPVFALFRFNGACSVGKQQIPIL